MKFVCGGMMVILGLLFERDNEVEGEPIVRDKEGVKGCEDEDEEEETRCLNNQG